jgi:small subunit ribosomal protein S20
MAKRIKSGLKRRRQDEVRRSRNRAVRTRVRNTIKELRDAIAAGDAGEMKKLLPHAVSVIDTSVRKGVLQRNAAARFKSRLSSQVGTLLQAKQG